MCHCTTQKPNCRRRGLLLETIMSSDSNKILQEGAEMEAPVIAPPTTTVPVLTKRDTNSYPSIGELIITRVEVNSSVTMIPLSNVSSSNSNSGKPNYHHAVVIAADANTGVVHLYPIPSYSKGIKATGDFTKMNLPVGPPNPTTTHHPFALKPFQFQSGDPTSVYDDTHRRESYLLMIPAMLKWPRTWKSFEPKVFLDPDELKRIYEYLYPTPGEEVVQPHMVLHVHSSEDIEAYHRMGQVYKVESSEESDDFDEDDVEEVKDYYNFIRTLSTDPVVRHIVQKHDEEVAKAKRSATSAWIREVLKAEHHG